MKGKILTLAALCVLVTSIVFAADFKKDIIGTWEFDLGGGFMAVTEYKANGTFSQKMGETTIPGTYTVQGSKLTTIASGKTTVFTIEKSDKKTMTVKRDTDGKTMIYKRK